MTKKAKKRSKKEREWCVGIHPSCNADNIVHPYGGGEIVVRQDAPVVVPESVAKELLELTYNGEPLFIRLADEED